jgi:acyl-CoA synthetase (AMP-forming)/AMP-acid ligase II
MSPWDLIGYLAATLVLVAFCMREMVPLRIAALCSNLAFIAYGLGLDLAPVWLLHALLLPTNCCRLLEALRSRRTRTRQAPCRGCPGVRLCPDLGSVLPKSSGLRSGIGTWGTGFQKFGTSVMYLTQGLHRSVQRVDRIKDMIISGGENVYSTEVENAIAGHPAVAACAVIGVPDPKWGERVHAVIVPMPARTPDAEEIRAHCRRLIAGYKAPRSFEFVQALPVSPAGKVLKHELRRPYGQGAERQVN